MQPEVTLVIELIMEVERRCQVGDITDSIDIDTSVVLNEVRVLGLYKESYIEVIFLHIVTQGHAQVMGVVLVFRITAQVLVEVGIHLVIDRPEPRIPVTVCGHDTGKDILWQMTEVISLAVALVLTITQLVVKLQMGTLPERFAIGGADDIATVIRRCRTIPGGIIGRVLPCLVLHLEEMYLIVGRVLILAVATVSLQTEYDIPSTRVQTAIELKHSPRILVTAIGEAGIQVVVDEMGS